MLDRREVGRDRAWVDLQHGRRRLAQRKLLPDHLPFGPKLRDRNGGLLLRDEAFHITLVGAVIGSLRGGQARLGLSARADGIGGEALPLGVVGFYVDVDQGPVFEPLAQTFDDGPLDPVGVEAMADRAASTLLHGRADEPDAAVVAILDRQPTAARLAPEQAGEQVLRLSAVLGLLSASQALHGAGADEQVVVDDAEMLGRGGVPVRLDVGTADALAGVRVLQHADPIPHEHAVVERVRQDAVAALPVAVDGHGGPSVASRRRDTFGVELARDGAGRMAGDIVRDDTADHGGLLFDDLKLAWATRHGAIAIGAAAGMASVADDARHAAARLMGEILQVQRADQPADADLDLIGDPVVNRLDLDAGEGQALEDAGEVFLVAADAVEGLDDQDIELPIFRGIEQPHDAVAVDERRTGPSPVIVGRHHRETVSRGEISAERDLVFDGAITLKVAGKSAVDRGAMHLRFGPGIGGAPRDRWHGRGGPALSQVPRRA